MENEPDCQRTLLTQGHRRLGSSGLGNGRSRPARRRGERLGAGSCWVGSRGLRAADRRNQGCFDFHGNNERAVAASLDTGHLFQFPWDHETAVAARSARVSRPRRSAARRSPGDRQRSGTGRSAIAEDGRVRRPCPNQRNKSERKENMRQPQLCSMPVPRKTAPHYRPLGNGRLPVVPGIDLRKAIKSARSWGVCPFSRPSGMSDSPVEATASIWARGTTSVAPRARFSVSDVAGSEAMIPEIVRPSVVATL